MAGKYRNSEKKYQRDAQEFERKEALNNSEESNW